jgi:hypothetical protein
MVFPSDLDPLVTGVHSAGDPSLLRPGSVSRPFHRHGGNLGLGSVPLGSHLIDEMIQLVLEHAGCALAELHKPQSAGGNKLAVECGTLDTEALPRFSRTKDLMGHDNLQRLPLRNDGMRWWLPREIGTGSTGYLKKIWYRLRFDTVPSSECVLSGAFGFLAA